MMTMTSALMKPALVAQKPFAIRTQRSHITSKASATRLSIVCKASKEEVDGKMPRAVSQALGAMAAAQLLLGAAAVPTAFAAQGSGNLLGAPAQNKEATDLPSTFFKTGDELQKKLGADVNPQDLGKKIDGSTPNIRGASQVDARGEDTSRRPGGDAGDKAFQNITPDLSELPTVADLPNLPNPFDSTGVADKAKGLAKDAARAVPDPSEAVDKAKAAGKDLGKGVSPSGAADKAKGLGKELGRNVPDPSAAADKAKGAAKGLANDLPNPANALKNKRI